MPGAIGVIFVMVAAGEFLVGGFANGFIGLVNFMDWVKTGRMSSMDLILTALAISRILLLGSLTSIIIMLNFFLGSYDSGKVRYFQLIWNFSNHLSAWFGTCLSIFYFLKISSFSHPVFLWLKWRVDKVVLRMICICLLIALLVNLLLKEKITEIYSINAVPGNKTNGTQEMQITKCLHFFTLILYFMGGFVPLIFSLISCFLLVFSLWRHTQQMQGSGSTSRDSSTEVHKKTMKSMVSFLFLFLLYHVGIIMASLSYALFESLLPVIFSMIITAIYPMAHSLILIQMNSKLRQASLRILGQLKPCPQGI
ncbi:taste receptor type 2 member 7-like [Petaurus breviceps papuanus]|uniref:taste receptor type 2 member 7-like n=1 Tax=Petaurus breviceps papuanus TaxID=3040969 RepID=UPI0036DB3268